MAPTIFPNLLEVLVQHLQTTEAQAWLNCYVGQEVPKDRPARYVNLQQVPVGGGAQSSIVLASRRVIAQTNDTSLFLSGTLCETLRGLLVDTKYQGLGIKRVNVIGEPASFPAPNLPYRWQVTADFLLRAKASAL